MVTEEELRRAQPADIADYAAVLGRVRDAMHVVADGVTTARQSFQAQSAGLSAAATVVAAAGFSSRLGSKVSEVGEAVEAVSVYGGHVADLQARLAAARGEVDDAEAAFARQGSVQALALEAYERLLGIGAHLLDAAKVDQAATDLRHERARWEAAGSRVAATHAALNKVLDEYEAAVQALIRSLMPLDFYYQVARRDLSDPAPLASGQPGRGDYSQKPLFGSLGRPTVQGVTQGDELGDCYFAAALIALVNSKDGPAEIQRMIQQNPDGTYTVHFRDGDVTVDGDLGSDGSINAHADDDHGYWAAILEKAYAKRRGSYEGVEGGSAGDVLRDAFGVGSGEHQSVGDAEIAGVVAALAAQRPATIGVDMHSLMPGQFAAGKDGHALAVTKTWVDAKGVRHFTITNPWNAGDQPHLGTLPDGRSLQIGGSFDVTEEEFREIASSVSY